MIPCECLWGEQIGPSDRPNVFKVKLLNDVITYDAKIHYGDIIEVNEKLGEYYVVLSTQAIENAKEHITRFLEYCYKTEESIGVEDFLESHIDEAKKLYETKQWKALARLRVEYGDYGFDNYVKIQ